MNSFNPSTINEIERLRINNLYFPMEKQEKNYVFESLITVDGKYMIFKDEVFDIVEQKLLGNICHL
jgi:predicted double-glycine peptidase